MRYVLLVYTADARLDTLSLVELEAMMVEEAGDPLLADHHVLTRGTLHEGSSATTLRVRNGRLILQDGPCTPGSGQLAGIYVITARDLNDAIRVAARVPPARFGSIEVRAVREPRPRS